MGVGQKDSFGDLLGGIGPPMPQQPAEPVTPSKQVENKAPPMPGMLLNMQPSLKIRLPNFSSNVNISYTGEIHSDHTSRLMLHF